MSTKGVYSALSGAVAQESRLETISNNIANANTVGFKKDSQTFREYLSAFEKSPEVIAVPKVPASVESFYDHQGGDRGYVDASGTYTDFSQGTLKPTGNRLDVALEGTGFFEVATPQGPRFTRSGNFSLDAEGRLVTKQGQPVLRAGTEAPEERVIRVTDSQFSVSASGEIYQNGQSVGQLSIVGFQNPTALKKMGNSLYELKENIDAQRVDRPVVTVHQGFIENSNINVIQEMTDMITATRVFESTQRAIKAYDQIDDQLVNTVPRF